MMQRRSFLRLMAGAGVAAVLPPIWFPLAPHGGREPGDAILPNGLGLAVPLDFPAHERQAYFDRAIAAFQPVWTYHWRIWPVTDHDGFAPMICPHPWSSNPAWPVDLDLLRGYIRDMDAAGRDVRRIAWLLGNEPEYSGWSPERVVQAMQVQLDVMHQAGVHPQIVAPGCGIKEAGFDYLRRWCDAAWRAGLAFTLAIHIYDWRPWRLDQLWQRFCAWFDATGLGQVLVTECGAGPNRSMDEALAIMPWFYRLLDDPRVRALAGGAAYSSVAPNGDTYIGLMDDAGSVNALGRQWIAERNRRNA